jgi:hypothetical protein
MAQAPPNAAASVPQKQEQAGTGVRTETIVRQTPAIHSTSGTQPTTMRPSTATASTSNVQQDITELETRPGHSKRNRSIGRKIERVITVMLLSILLLVVALIVAASVSADMNTWITNTLHVDIRAEIAYLWQLITHLH